MVSETWFHCSLLPHVPLFIVSVPHIFVQSLRSSPFRLLPQTFAIAVPYLVCPRTTRSLSSHHDPDFPSPFPPQMLK